MCPRRRQRQQKLWLQFRSFSCLDYKSSLIFHRIRTLSFFKAAKWNKSIICRHHNVVVVDDNNLREMVIYWQWLILISPLKRKWQKYSSWLKLILPYSNCHHMDTHSAYEVTIIAYDLILWRSRVMTLSEQKMIKISWLCGSRTHAHDITWNSGW